VARQHKRKHRESCDDETKIEFTGAAHGTFSPSRPGGNEARRHGGGIAVDQGTATVACHHAAMMFACGIRRSAGQASWYRINADVFKFGEVSAAHCGNRQFAQGNART
jgi:hypothetical protein